MNKLLINEEPLVVLPSLAVAIGLNDAMFLQQVHYWVNRSKHIKDGSKWIYNSYEDWNEQFPFWSVSTIKRIIKDLYDRDLLKKGNFNKSSFDRTNWYTVNYARLTELADEIAPADEDLEGIDTIEGDEEPAPAPRKGKTKEKAVKLDQNTDPDFNEFWNVYPKKVSKKQAYAPYKRAKKSHGQAKIIMGTVGYAKQIQINKTDAQYIKNPSTFLNNDSFLDFLNLTPDPTDELKRPKQMAGIGEM